MGKSSFQKLKKYLLPINVLIIVVLFCAYHYVDTEIDKQKLIEGVVNSNCCGGIEAGVHYKETDRKPPNYVRRCFRSRHDGGDVIYEWNTMPCSTADSAQCCKNSDGSDLGQCVASTGGGYCKNDMGEKAYGSWARKPGKNVGFTNGSVSRCPRLAYGTQFERST